MVVVSDVLVGAPGGTRLRWCGSTASLGGTLARREQGKALAMSRQQFV